MIFVLGQPELFRFNGIENTFELCCLFVLQVISGTYPNLQLSPAVVRSRVLFWL